MSERHRPHAPVHASDRGRPCTHRSGLGCKSVRLVHRCTQPSGVATFSVVLSFCDRTLLPATTTSRSSYNRCHAKAVEGRVTVLDYWRTGKLWYTVAEPSLRPRKRNCHCRDAEHQLPRCGFYCCCHHVELLRTLPWRLGRPCLRKRGSPKSPRWHSGSARSCAALSAALAGESDFCLS